MKKLLLLAPLIFTISASAMSVILPSIEGMWKAADVVAVAKIEAIDADPYQGNLPERLDLVYTRVLIEMRINALLKGQLNPEQDIVRVPFFTAESKKKEDEGVFELLAAPPYLRQPLANEKYMLFLKYDAYGRLVPVDDDYFLILFRYGCEPY